MLTREAKNYQVPIIASSSSMPHESSSRRTEPAKTIVRGSNLDVPIVADASFWCWVFIGWLHLWWRHLLHYGVSFVRTLPEVMVFIQWTTKQCSFLCGLGHWDLLLEAPTSVSSPILFLYPYITQNTGNADATGRSSCFWSISVSLVYLG